MISISLIMTVIMRFLVFQCTQDVFPTALAGWLAWPALGATLSAAAGDTQGACASAFD